MLLWPKSDSIIHINYHYTQFGEVVDYIKNNVTPNIIVKDLDVEEFNLEELFIKENIDKIIMHVNYENVQSSFQLANKVKKSNSSIPIMAYGNIPMLHPKLFKNSDFSVIYKSGDFEKAIENFILYYKILKPKEGFAEHEITLNINKQDTMHSLDKNNIQKLKNLYLLFNNKYYFLRDEEYIKNDDWGITDKKYSLIYDKIKNKNRYIINFSRGCPFTCEHCLIQKTEGNQERRSIKNLKLNLSKISKEYNHIKFWAANFTLEDNYVLELCDMKIDNFPNLTWECATRIDLLKNEKVISKMSEAGCKQVPLGIETINNKKILGVKDFSKQLISEKISLLQNKGINVKACLMLGMKKQTKEDIFETFKFLLDRGVTLRPTIYTPYQDISENISIKDLHSYKRKTYSGNNIDGISNEQLFLLTKRPKDYIKILGLSKEIQKNNDFSIEL